jgi:hypothetical protein
MIDVVGAHESEGAAADHARRSRNLVVVRAGPNSLHERWLDGKSASERDFELLIAAYDERVEPNGAPGTSYLWSPGSKIRGYSELFRRHPELLERYDYFALFDDDLLASASQIERLFEVGRRYNLDLFQPALSWDSYFSYAATLAIPGYLLRFTNTVEMMCPVFSAAHLKRALPLFALGYETGIDLIWTRLTDEPWFRYAIVDAVVVRHTRPIGTTKTAQGFAADEDYDGKVSELLGKFGATFRGFVSYAAIDGEGQQVNSRYAIALRSAGSWAAWRTTPLAGRHFVRLATDFTRHCLWRPLNMGRIDLNAVPAEKCPAGFRLASERMI